MKFEQLALVTQELLDHRRHATHVIKACRHDFYKFQVVHYPQLYVIRLAVDTEISQLERTMART